MEIPSELLKLFSIDNWYKAFVYLGGVVLAFSLFVEVKGGLTNSQVQLLSGGVFLLALGEWKNHKHYSGIKPPNAYTGGVALITKTIWQPDLGGIFLDLLGSFLILGGLWKILQR